MTLSFLFRFGLLGRIVVRFFPLFPPTITELEWCFVDVGGGSVPNSTVHSLASISLRWMVRECFKTHTGILFKTEQLRGIGMDPMSLWPEVSQRPAALTAENARIQALPKKLYTPKHVRNVENRPVAPHLTEEELELRDALSPVFDQLSISRSWWLLELLPVKMRYQRGDGLASEWVEKWICNFGKGRFIPKQKKNGVRVHRSVKTRMDALHEDGSKYVPKAKFDLERVIWVD